MDPPSRKSKTSQVKGCTLPSINHRSGGLSDQPNRRCMRQCDRCISKNGQDSFLLGCK